LPRTVGYDAVQKHYLKLYRDLRPARTRLLQSWCFFIVIYSSEFDSPAAIAVYYWETINKMKKKPIPFAFVFLVIGKQRR
jgi:hypothetical protein